MLKYIPIILMLAFSGCFTSQEITDTQEVRIDTVVDIVFDTMFFTDTFVDVKIRYIHDTIKINCDESTQIEITRPKTFREVIGVNASLVPDNIMSKAYAFDNQRVFYLIDHDLHGVPLSMIFPRPSTAKCPNIDNGWETGNAAWVFRMCDYSNNFNTISLDLETIYYPDGTGGIVEKKYPNKSLSEKDLNYKPYEYGLKYGLLLKESMSQFVGKVNMYIAVANEPHGSPNYEVITRWSHGMSDGLEGSGIKLVSQDVQITGDDVFNGQVLFNNASKIDTSIFDVLQTHSYTFDENFRLSLAPEVSTTKWMSPLREIKDMSARYGDKKELWLTEFGFDSEILGQTTQAAYILRTIFLAMRYGYDKAFVYSIFDEPMLPFKNCGLVDKSGYEKVSYKELVGIINQYGDYYFDKVLHEDNGNFEYIFTNGDSSILVEWNIDDKTLPSITRYDK